MAANPPSTKPTRGGWKSAIFIIFVEVAERFAYYGVAGNLFMYLTKVLGQPTATAAKSVNTWQGVAAIFPVVGGFLADSYVGRFKTILISSIIYLIGIILLTVAVSTVPLEARHTVFFIALYILTVGEGGHKPCVQTFAADQFDESIPEEKAAKSSFFNWWYVGIVSGATAAVLVVIYVEDYVGWSLGFGMLAAAVAAALVVFLAGSGSYSREAPVGSPFTRVAQVVFAAVKKRRMSEGEARGVCVEDDDYGGVGMEGGGTGAGTLAPTSHFRSVLEFGCSEAHLPADPDLAELPDVLIAQLGTYFTKQTSTLNRSITRTFTIPPASFQVITGLLYERALVPISRAITAHPSGITILQRIGTGLLLSILTMVVAALVESRRLRVAAQHGLLDNPRAAVPMSAWWVVPQYVMCGLADVFAVVGLQELFYDQMPVGMRSVGVHHGDRSGELPEHCGDSGGAESKRGGWGWGWGGVAAAEFLLGFGRYECS
ncbi:hypothetical protein SASPL_131527 [Salvia splendens]|uniref:Solute carrier family 15 (Peptide/histidine transporter), member 3/4 n=1 Tax=Salvia splendens TaxID=180675 RepID=A0A8X8X979_SALSN|nr:hypothetical protein SASPL_131527 [Salvia splendens]